MRDKAFFEIVCLFQNLRRPRFLKLTTETISTKSRPVILLFGAQLTTLFRFLRNCRESNLTPFFMSASNLKRKRDLSSEAQPTLKRPRLSENPLTSTEKFLNRSGGTGIIFFFAMKDAQYRFLSNFAAVSPPFLIDDRPYTTVEHYFQSEKARSLGFPKLAEKIRLVDDVRRVKRLGGAAGLREHILSLDTNSEEMPRKLSHLFEAESGRQAKIEILREFVKERWNETFRNPKRLEEIMERGLTAKFQNEEMRRALLATGNMRLAEKRGRTGDANPWTMTKEGEPGKLGEMLMSIRERLRTEKERS